MSVPVKKDRQYTVPGWLMWAGVRYGLQSRNYAFGDTIAFVRQNWQRFDIETRTALLRDIRDAESRWSYADPFNPLPEREQQLSHATQGIKC